MAGATGPYVFDGVDAKNQLKEDQYVALRDRTTGNILIPKMWCDVSTDNDRGWFLVFTAFPRIRSPYVTTSYGNIPTTSDEDMNKLSDDNIRTALLKAEPDKLEPNGGKPQLNLVRFGGITVV